MRLAFLSANWHRKYPFTAASSLVSTNGEELPNDIIVACRIVTDAVNKSVQISRLYISNGNINIEFKGSVCIGTATGNITRSNQTIPIKGLISTCSGFVTIGNPASLQVNKVYNFDSGAAVLEPSTVTILQPPGVSKLIHNDKTLTGKVTLTSDTLSITYGGRTVSLAVLRPSELASRTDKTSALLTCAQPSISGINSVIPIPPDNNIDVIGIAPVTISVVAGKLTIGTSPGGQEIKVEDICKPVNIPPIDETNDYHEDVTTTEQPEWKSWTQYNQ